MKSIAIVDNIPTEQFIPASWNKKLHVQDPHLNPFELVVD